MMEIPHEGRSEKVLNTHRHQVRELTTEQDWREAWPVVNALRPYCSASAENGNQAIAASLVSEQLFAL